jgi:hypothetical protein
MNILQAEDLVKGYPDQRLMQEAKSPSNPEIPQFLFLSEIQRRGDMRKRHQAQEQQSKGTIADQILQGGIQSLGGVPRGTPPQMNMPGARLPPTAPADHSQMPRPPAPSMRPPMPQQRPPGMAQGGIVRMAGPYGQVPGVAAPPKTAKVVITSPGSFYGQQVEVQYGEGTPYATPHEAANAMLEAYDEPGLGMTGVAADQQRQARAVTLPAVNSFGPGEQSGYKNIGLPDSAQRSLEATIAASQPADDLSGIIAAYLPSVGVDASNQEDSFDWEGIGLSLKESFFDMARKNNPAVRAKPDPDAEYLFDQMFPTGQDRPVSERTIAALKAQGWSDDPAKRLAGSGITTDMEARTFLGEPNYTPKAKTSPGLPSLIDEGTKGSGVEVNGGTESDTIKQLKALLDEKGPDAPDFSELIKEQKSDAFYGAMAQVAAGIGAGDMSKGIAAATNTAMEGRQGARQLEQASKMQDYRGGREDLTRKISILSAAGNIEASLARAEAYAQSSGRLDPLMLERIKFAREAYKTALDQGASQQEATAAVVEMLGPMLASQILGVSQGMGQQKSRAEQDFRIVH